MLYKTRILVIRACVFVVNIFIAIINQLLKAIKSNKSFNKIILQDKVSIMSSHVNNDLVVDEKITRLIKNTSDLIGEAQLLEESITKIDASAKILCNKLFASNNASIAEDEIQEIENNSSDLDNKIFIFSTKKDFYNTKRLSLEEDLKKLNEQNIALDTMTKIKDRKVELDKKTADLDQKVLSLELKKSMFNNNVLIFNATIFKQYQCNKNTNQDDLFSTSHLVFNDDFNKKFVYKKDDCKPDELLFYKKEDCCNNKSFFIVQILETKKISLDLTELNIENVTNTAVSFHVLFMIPVNIKLVSKESLESIDSNIFFKESFIAAKKEIDFLNTGCVYSRLVNFDNDDGLLLQNLSIEAKKTIIKKAQKAYDAAISDDINQKKIINTSESSINNEILDLSRSEKVDADIQKGVY